MSEKQTITTHEAAEILGVPHRMLSTVLDEEESRSVHSTSGNRRLFLDDVLAVRKERDRNRHAALDRLAESVEAAGLYNGAYTGR